MNVISGLPTFAAGIELNFICPRGDFGNHPGSSPLADRATVKKNESERQPAQ